MDNIFGNNARFNSDQEEGFADIPTNRTLMAGQYTGEAAANPAIATGLQTLEQLFTHFRPEVTVDFRDTNGRLKEETLRFTKLEDFSLNGLEAQSPQLRSTAAQKDTYLHIINQLRNNQKLQAALADPAAKKALQNTIQGLMTILKNHS
jgi:predicted component of type VI protein secretion system